MTTPSALAKPLPHVTPENREFWEGCKQGLLKIPKCGVCSRLFFPPSARCPYCLSTAVQWTTASGRGIVYTFTVVRRAPSVALQKDVPYVIGSIELAEGVRIPSRVVGCPPEAVKVGMPVTAQFQKESDEITVPLFAPISR